MTKAKYIVLFIFIIGIVSLLTYLNYDKIFNYFTNKEWEIAGSVGKIELEDYLALSSTNSNFIVVGNNNIAAYSSNARESFDKTLTSKDVSIHSVADYCIIGDKELASVNVFSENKLVWSTNISNAEILGAYINKNGYSAVIYTQTGYKSLIKVFSNTGKELFTNYLASTYAVDVAISNDNKFLAIAEVDAEGINLESNIKLIDIKEASENNVKKYSLNTNELVTDIEYNENNNLIIMTDAAVKILENEDIKEVVNFKNENVLMANIENRKNVVTVNSETEGLFNSKYEVAIYDFDTLQEPKKYTLDEVPNKIVCLKNSIAVDTGNKVLFLNSSANFMKKCEYNGQLKEIRIFDDGNTAALIFRDYAEFIKLNGLGI